MTGDLREVPQPGVHGFANSNTSPLPPQSDFAPNLEKCLDREQGGAGERHGLRFLAFGAIGGSVFAIGLASQIALVHFLHLDVVAAYILQGIFSIQLSFLLNRYLTWRDRKAPFLGALWRFNVQKAVATVINFAAYAVIVRLGIHYVVANIFVTAVFTPLNYVIAHYWSFQTRAQAATTAEQVPRAGRDLLPTGSLPTVSVVIPCKNSAQTIRATVEALLLQDYPGLENVFVVGDVDDPTWAALTDVTDPRLSILEHEPTDGRRDPNVKRDMGIRKSTSDVLALVDSDIVTDPGWLSRAVAMLLEQGGGLVAGGMRSIEDTFWGRFVDQNVLAAKTPRVPVPYHVTVANFGKRGCKPPITANAVFTRQLYEACPLDIAWPYGYEDYEWFWRLAKAGHKILFSGQLTAAHHHRSSFRQLVREYRRSARGCAHFIRTHPESPLARKRLRQAMLPPLGGVIALAGLGIADRLGPLVGAGVVLAAAAVLLATREIGKARSVEAAVYPAVGLALCLVYAWSLLSSLGQIAVTGRRGVAAGDRTTQADDTMRPDEQPGLAQSPRRPHWWLLAPVLCLQTALSLSLVWANTASGEEASYLVQGRLEWSHWLHGSPLPPNSAFTGLGAPQIYPPLGALADSIGGLTGARILSMCFMLGASALLYLVARRCFGDRAAIIGTALWGVSEPVVRLAYATPDALSCFLVALAGWATVQAGIQRRRGELVTSAAILLALASTATYSFVVMIPAFVAFAFFVWQSSLGTRMALCCASWLTAGFMVLVFVFSTFFHLWADARYSTFTRAASTTGAGAAVIRSVWSWDGFMLALAAAGVALAFASGGNWNRRLLHLTVFSSALLVPVYQEATGAGAWLLDERMSAGTWLLAMGAGYAAARLAALSRWRTLASAAAAALFLMYPAVTGIWYARSAFHMWPNVGALTKQLGPLANSRPGPVLATTTNQAITILEYYLLRGDDWSRWEAAGSGATRIGAGKFALVVLDLGGTFESSTLLADAAHYSQSTLASEILQLASGTRQFELARELLHSPDYHIKLAIPYVTSNNASSTGLFVVWQQAGRSGNT